MNPDFERIGRAVAAGYVFRATHRLSGYMLTAYEPNGERVGAVFQSKYWDRYLAAVRCILALRREKGNAAAAA